MAHEVESMMSVGETPWHGLGKVLVSPPNGAEAIKQAGLGWTVREEKLFTADGREVEAKAIVRDSDDEILGHHVGKNWTPIQNADVFGFFDPLIDAGQAIYETAGSLRGGTRVWALARLGGDDMVIVPKADDRVRRYLLLSNSHDGTLAVSVGFTPIRVVCANTLRMALDDKKESKLLKLLHTKGVKDTLEMVRDAVNVANQRFEATAETYRTLASRNIDATTLEKYVYRVFDSPTPSKSKDAIDGLLAKFTRKDQNARARYEAIGLLFERGRGNDLLGVKGTAWAAYNAVTEYLQYERPRSTAESRLDSLTFGEGAATSRRALHLALEMTDV